MSLNHLRDFKEIHTSMGILKYIISLIYTLYINLYSHG